MIANHIVNIILAAFLVCLIPHSAIGASGSEWQLVSDGLSSQDEPGFVRDEAGALHLFLRKDTGGKDSLAYYELSLSKAVISSPIVVLSSWDTITNSSPVINSDGTLRVFFGGIQDTFGAGSYNAGKLYSATSNAARTTFLLDAGPLSDNSAVYTSEVVSALKSSSGEIFASWAPGVVFFRSLLNPGDVQGDVSGCCSYFQGIAEDFSTKEIIGAWYSNIGGLHGVLYQKIFPEKGALSFAPASSSKDKNSSLPVSQRIGIVGRKGKKGTYIAYCGGYPVCRDARLLKVGESQSSSIIKRKGLKIVSAASGAGGSIWLYAVKGKNIFLTRSNNAATTFDAPTSFTLPREATRAVKLIGEGSRRFLDLFLLAETNSGYSLFHKRIRS